MSGCELLWPLGVCVCVYVRACVWKYVSLVLCFFSLAERVLVCVRARVHVCVCARAQEGVRRNSFRPSGVQNFDRE
jgi:hypothetical protein